MIDRYLFRGKRLDNGEWVQGCYIFVPDSGHEHYIYCADSAHPMDTGFYEVHKLMFAVDPATICQCTGLHDKNGTLIFEGDYVKFCRNDDENYVGKVVWLDCCFHMEIEGHLQWERLCYVGNCYEII